ncbi:Hypothetical_protein [Hexamita inflata]|uniref:Hypothetical_protein n=1 Tax=Hexamita inflata TaxID=28002 RepID=A0AA86NIN9_9EUKA|nr:Hypothetical protein HINF_LOCUS7565 [Hexamita inflata]CAI9919923.1 Hypothetical protein HINF_LOCUS7568 [Hexamita inflata]
MPYIFSSGSYSSCLLSQVTQSSLQLNDVAVILGNNSKNNDLVSAPQTSTFLFGGLVTRLVGSTIRLNQFISSCQLNFNTQNMQQSGFLIGYAVGNSNSIQIENTCMYYVVFGTGTYTYFGVIGQNDGNITFKKSQISLSGTLAYYDNFGVIGYQTAQSSYSLTTDIQIILNINNGSAYGQAGSLFGANNAAVKQISNIQVNKSNLFVTVFSGGLVGSLAQTSAQIQNVTIQSTNLSCQKHGCGGIFGYVSNSSIQVKNSTVYSVRISAQSGYGQVLGFISGSVSLNIQNSKSLGNNYINNALQQNCPNFTSVVPSVTQC